MYVFSFSRDSKGYEPVLRTLHTRELYPILQHSFFNSALRKELLHRWLSFFRSPPPAPLHFSLALLRFCTHGPKRSIIIEDYASDDAHRRLGTASPGSSAADGNLDGPEPSRPTEPRRPRLRTPRSDPRVRPPSPPGSSYRHAGDRQATPNCPRHLAPYKPPGDGWAPSSHRAALHRHTPRSLHFGEQVCGGQPQRQR